VARGGVAGLLIGAALAASTVRGTAQPAVKAESASTVLLPFDLTYVPEKSDGIFVLRPAELLGRPEMKPLVERWNGSIAAAIRQLGIGTTIDIATIEQVVGPFELKTMTDEEVKETGRPERHSVIMGLAMVRMTRDYDWPELLKALAPVVETKEVKPGTFECRCPAFGPHPFTVQTPDARTLVLAVPGQPVVRTDSNAERWGAAMKRVERAGYVVLLDNRTGRWTDSLAENKEAAPIAAVLNKPRYAAFGLNWGERVSVTCAAEWADPPTDADVARGAETLRGLLMVGLGEAPVDPTERLMYGLASVLLRDARVKRDGAVVTAEAVAEAKWVEVLEAIPMDEPTKKGKIDVQAEKKEKK
jgi:hypothetical protein